MSFRSSLFLVTVHNLAIGVGSSIYLYVPRKKGKDRSQGATTFRDVVKRKKRSGAIDKYDRVDVDSMSLEAFLEAEEIYHVDLLKLNCEGAEYFILPDLPSCVQAVFVSWHMDKSFATKVMADNYAASCRRMELLGMEKVSDKKRGDHTWEFWRKP